MSLSSYFLQCRGDKWPTAGRMWWPGTGSLWPGKAACRGPPTGRTRGCWSWRNTSPHGGNVSDECTESARRKTRKQTNHEADDGHDRSSAATGMLSRTDLWKPEYFTIFDTVSQPAEGKYEENVSVFRRPVFESKYFCSSQEVLQLGLWLTFYTSHSCTCCPLGEESIHVWVLWGVFSKLRLSIAVEEYIF